MSESNFPQGEGICPTCGEVIAIVAGLGPCCPNMACWRNDDLRPESTKETSRGPGLSVSVPSKTQSLNRPVCTLQIAGGSVRAGLHFSLMGTMKATKQDLMDIARMIQVAAEQVAADPSKLDEVLSVEPPYWIQTFWSPDKRFLVSAHVTGSGIDPVIVLQDDNGIEWEMAGDLTRLPAFASETRPDDPGKNCPECEQRVCVCCVPNQEAPQK